MGATEVMIRAALADTAVEGRTLVGLAVPWLTPARVSDDGGRSFYLEAFRADSADRSIAQRGVYPAFVNHPGPEGAVPIGAATFERAEDGLRFQLPVTSGARGDETLELVESGAMRSVSIGFRPLGETRATVAGESVVLRTEVALRELSVVPTGFGQYPTAGVDAIRGELVVPDEHDAALSLDLRWRAAQAGIA